MKKIVIRKKSAILKNSKTFFMDLKLKKRTYIQTTFQIKNHHTTSSSQARSHCRNFLYLILSADVTKMKKIRYVYLVNM